jgi:methyl-accepting chemotaxis protein
MDELVNASAEIRAAAEVAARAAEQLAGEAQTLTHQMQWFRVA